MLSTMRQHSRSLLIYILFGIVIAVFIINFGPGSKGCGGSITDANAAKVAGQSVPEADFTHAIQLMGFDQMPNDAVRQQMMRQYVMDRIIQRELLAQEAEKLGLHVSVEEIEDRIGDGRITVLGQTRNIKLDPRFAVIYKDGFDVDKFRKNFCQFFLHTTENKFKEEQRREVLADKIKELLRANTKVSPDEVKSDFIERETQVKLGYVRFASRPLEEETVVTPADVEGYLAKSNDKVKEAYDARAFIYKAVPHEVRVRGILYAVAKDAPEADAKKQQGRANGAADRIAHGTDMAELARKESEDPKSKARGGDLRWIRKGAIGYGPEFDAKVIPLKKGDAPVVAKTDRGFWVARVEDAREGDLSFDQVKKELAEDMLRRDRAGEKAKKDAEAAMAKIKGGAKLGDLFPKAEEAKDENASDEEQAKAAPKKPAKPAGDPNAPKLRETQMFARHGNSLEDIGVSKDATDQVFDKLKKGETAGPFEIQGGGTSYVIVQLEDRKDPDLAAFEKKKDDIARDLEQSKWAMLLGDLARKRCIEAREAGRISVSHEVLGGGEEAAAYQPCGPGPLR
jgi:peptidyl-prolyl cis-trans isomerase D